VFERGWDENPRTSGFDKFVGNEFGQLEAGPQGASHGWTRAIPPSPPLKHTRPASRGSSCLGEGGMRTHVRVGLTKSPGAILDSCKLARRARAKDGLAQSHPLRHSNTSRAAIRHQSHSNVPVTARAGIKWVDRTAPAPGRRSIQRLRR
jgi:hypothetical protein